MFEFFRQSLEADAAKRGEQLVAKVQAARLRHQTFWFSYLAASISAFALLLIGRITATKNPAHVSVITVAAVSLATVLVAATHHFIRDYALLDKVAVRYRLYQTRLRTYAQTDYLLWHRWAAWVFALLPYCAICDRRRRPQSSTHHKAGGYSIRGV